MSTAKLIANPFAISDLQHDLLGRGARSVGEVHRATDAQTGESVAVKVLDPQVAARDLEATIQELLVQLRE